MRGIDKHLASAWVAVVALFGAAAVARADELHERVSQANALMAEGKVDEATAIYQQDLAALGEKAPVQLWYDAGCAMLAGKQFEQAEVPLRVALSRAGDDRLRSAAAFNLGVLEARRAEGKAKDGLDAVVDSLRKAERYFRTAATADPSDASATKNVDLVQRRIAAVQEQQKQERQQKQDNEKKDKSKDNKDGKSGDSKSGDGKNSEQQPDKNDQQKDDSLSDQLNDLAKKQEEAGKDSKNLSDKADKGEPKEKLAEDQAKAAQKQQDLSKHTEKARKEAESKSQSAQDQAQKEAIDKAKENLDKDQEAQKKAEDKLKEGDTKSAEQLQKEAAQKLQDAAQQAKASQEAKEKAEQTQQAQQQEQQGQQEPGKDMQPFDATAAQILDQERKNKQQAQRIQRQRVRPVQVKKDW
jgi:hypothetical protein